MNSEFAPAAPTTFGWRSLARLVGKRHSGGSPLTVRKANAAAAAALQLATTVVGGPNRN